MLRLAMLVIACVVFVADAGAHGPATAIGRAVLAFGSLPISYDPEAEVTDLEADRFNAFVGSNPKVAFMPASASDEIAGGPDAIAEEIAREAGLNGTLVVLVGSRLGAWSDDIDDDRLAELLRDARAPREPLFSSVETFVRSVQAEPTSDPPWAWIGVGLVLVAIGALAGFHLVTRRRGSS